MLQALNLLLWVLHKLERFVPAGQDSRNWGSDNVRGPLALTADPSTVARRTRFTSVQTLRNCSETVLISMCD